MCKRWHRQSQLSPTIPVGNACLSLPHPCLPLLPVLPGSVLTFHNAPGVEPSADPLAFGLHHSVTADDCKGGALLQREAPLSPAQPPLHRHPFTRGQAQAQQNSRRKMLVGKARGHPHVPQSRASQPSCREKPKALGSTGSLVLSLTSAVLRETLSAGACFPSLKGSSTRKPEQRGWDTKQVGQCTPRAGIYRLCCSLLRRESKPIVPL